MCVHVCRYPKKPEEGVKFSRAGVTDGCKPSSMGAENFTVLVWKSFVSSSLLNHLSRPPHI